jgi:hypothetical protein
VKKILFFFLYIGDNLSSIEEVDKRILHAKKEMNCLSEVINGSNVFDEKYLIPVAPSTYDRIIRNITTYHNLEIYKDNIYNVNMYEYPAFLAMKEKALENSNSLFFYAHAKGTGNPSPDSFNIFKLHVSRLLASDIDNIFLDKKINKVGLFPSMEGWLWHNFFWVRSDYLINKELIITDNRYKYESYIGEAKDINNYKTCFSPLSLGERLGEFETKQYYHPDDLDMNPLFQKLLMT